LRASLAEPAKVVVPAFTCSAVHEAVVRSGGNIHLVDASSDDFLVAEEALARAQSGKHAAVLCEVYGHTYDLEKIARNAHSPPVVRIIDMAMAVPEPALLRRLRSTDFAVISFGIGKSMYAGWGAIGFAGNGSLATEVIKLRDSCLAPATLKLQLKRIAEITLRTLAHYHSAYALAKKLQRPPSPGTETHRSFVTGLPASWSEGDFGAPEWCHPATNLDRGLALWNLKRAECFRGTRLALAGRYQANLAGAKGVTLPKVSQYALSHYTVRLAPDIRNLVKRRLFETGINAITLWEFPQYLNRMEFLNAFRLSSQVLNLPLSPWLSPRLVDRICKKLADSVQACSK
jgi:dTDP-4-amino-4,6-dideoxygalactose transaminase